MCVGAPAFSGHGCRTAAGDSALAWYTGKGARPAVSTNGGRCRLHLSPRHFPFWWAVPPTAPHPSSIARTRSRVPPPRRRVGTAHHPSPWGAHRPPSPRHHSPTVRAMWSNAPAASHAARAHDTASPQDTVLHAPTAKSPGTARHAGSSPTVLHRVVMDVFQVRRNHRRRESCAPRIVVAKRNAPDAVDVTCRPVPERRARARKAPV